MDPNQHLSSVDSSVLDHDNLALLARWVYQLRRNHRVGRCFHFQARNAASSILWKGLRCAARHYNRDEPWPVCHSSWRLHFFGSNLRRGRHARHAFQLLWLLHSSLELQSVGKLHGAATVQTEEERRRFEKLRAVLRQIWLHVCEETWWTKGVLPWLMLQQILLLQKVRSIKKEPLICPSERTIVKRDQHRWYHQAITAVQGSS